MEYPDNRAIDEQEMAESYKKQNGYYPKYAQPDNKPIKYPMTPREKLKASRNENSVDYTSIERTSRQHQAIRDLTFNPYTK